MKVCFCARCGARIDAKAIRSRGTGRTFCPDVTACDRRATLVEKLLRLGAA